MKKATFYISMLFLACGCHDPNDGTPPAEQVPMADAKVAILKYGKFAGMIMKIFDNDTSSKKKALATNYQENVPVAFYMRRHELENVLSDQSISGVRMYMGMTCQGVHGYMIPVTNGIEKPLAGDMVYDFVTPCPHNCPSSSQLYPEFTKGRDTCPFTAQELKDDSTKACTDGSCNPPTL